MFRRGVFQCVMVLAVSALTGHASAREVIYDLGAPSIVGNTAEMTLGLEFIPGAGPDEGLVFWQIDAENSSDSLTGPAGSKDYSVLSFSPASPLLDLWFETPFGSLTPDVPLLAYDDDFGTGAPILPGVHVLGTLIADLNGIAPGTSVTVAIDGSSTDAIYLDGNFDGDLVPVSYVNPSRTFSIPGVTVIPLPAAAWMSLPLFAGFALRRFQRRTHS